MNHIPSTVFWLTGLSGAGKTTIGRSLCQRLRSMGEPVIFLDGDVLREIYNNAFGHDRDQRLLASQQYGRLCKLLSEQHVHVICATISMFHQTQAWNRENIKNYVEIFVDVPLPELIARDSKGIYSRGLNGSLSNIVGLDIEPEYPLNPDMIINNSGGMNLESVVDKIISHCLPKEYKKRISTNAS